MGMIGTGAKSDRNSNQANIAAPAQAIRDGARGGSDSHTIVQVYYRPGTRFRCPQAAIRQELQIAGTRIFLTPPS